LSGLFGTKSGAALAPVKQHMRTIAQGMTHLDRGLQVQGDPLASFIEMSAVRMDSFRNLTTMQEHAIAELCHELGLIFNSQTQDQQRVVMAIRQLQRYITHLRHIDELRQGIELLLHGILTPQLVPKSTLRQNLLIIKSHLERHFPNFRLVFDRTSPFYTLHGYLFGRHGKRLLIQTQIPVTTFHHEFTVYKVTNFPVPVTGRPTHITFLPNLRRYFVTSRYSDFYFTIQNNDNKRHPRLLYLTDSGTSFSSLSTGATCVSALYRNNITQTRELCPFTLQEDPLEPQVHFLSNSRILRTNVSEITLNCGTSDRTFHGCTQCVREIPCNFEVKLFPPNSSQPSRIWLPKLSSCRNEVNITKTRYVVNLAALQSFFTDTSLGSLTGNTYLSQPLPVELSAFRQYKHKYHQFVSNSKDIKRSHNLRKFSNRVKNDSVVFHGILDVLKMSNIISSNDDDSPRFSHISWWLT